MARGSLAACVTRTPPFPKRSLMLLLAGGWSWDIHFFCYILYTHSQDTRHRTYIILCILRIVEIIIPHTNRWKYLEFPPSPRHFNGSLHLPRLLLAPPARQVRWCQRHRRTFVVTDVVVEELHIHLHFVHLVSKFVEDVLPYKLWGLELFLADCA